MGFIAPLLGAQKLGYNLTVVLPGKRAFPFHNHRVNEEMFFVIEGAGEVRIGEAVYPIRSRDVVACPAGEPETAHHDDQHRHAGAKVLCDQCHAVA